MKNQKLKISVIIPVYNGAKTLERAIKSVVNQTYSNIELIIIDGNSTDRTLNIIRRHKNKINYWISKKDKGIYDAMNKGIKKSTGDILYFLGSDDYLYGNEIFSQIIPLFSSKSIYLIEGDVLKTNLNKKNKKISGKIFLRDLLAGRRPPHQGVFIKKNKLLSIGLFDIEYNLASDFDFFCKFFIKYNDNAKYIQRIICVYNGAGASSNRDKTNNESSKIIRKHFGYLSSILFIIKKYIRKILHYY